MAGYHVVLVHFPIALFMTATLAILLRAISDGTGGPFNPPPEAVFDSRRQTAHRRMQRCLVGSAAHVELDGNARISVPSSHRAAVGIEKKAVLLGMGDKFELWSEQAHHAQIRQTLGDADLGEDLVGLQL